MTLKTKPRADAVSPSRAPTLAEMTGATLISFVRVYMRRSRKDEGKQEYSIPCQKDGSLVWIGKSPYAGWPVAFYVDEGISGDDFVNRADLRRMMGDVRPGDVVVCRDDSRLGRDALETTLMVRELVRDRGVLLYYYVTNERVLMETAIQQAMTFVRATGRQIELESIRSNVGTAARARVRMGRIASGRCYGYRNVRITDGAKGHTVAVIDEEQAEVVRQIFRWRGEGLGFKWIAHQLNASGVSFLHKAGGPITTWTPAGVRWIVRNPRYRGQQIHGRITKVRRGGVCKREKADPTAIMVEERPEWRIVDDATWFAANARSQPKAPGRYVPSPRAKYALTANKCGGCRGSIGVAYIRSRPCYACTVHHDRGASVCPVNVYQPIAEVEGALTAYIQREILTPDIVAQVTGEIRAELEAQLPRRAADIAPLEAELQQVRAEHARLSRAVALADDVDGIVAELNARSARARALEVQIASSRRAPAELAALIDQAEATIRERFASVQTALMAQDNAVRRTAFARLFPDGLLFTPTEAGDRRIWRIKGASSLGSLVVLDSDPWFTLHEDSRQPSRGVGKARRRSRTGAAGSATVRGHMRATALLVCGLLGVAACDFEGQGTIDGAPGGPDAADGPLPDAAPDDSDGDGFANPVDNCPLVANPSQHDEDGDRVGDACDNCPTVVNPTQPNMGESSLGGVADTAGDACDPFPTRPGNDILFFDGFGTMDPLWSTTRGDWRWIEDGVVRADSAGIAHLYYRGDHRGDMVVDTTAKLLAQPGGAFGFGPLAQFDIGGSVGVGYACQLFDSPSAFLNVAVLKLQTETAPVLSGRVHTAAAPSVTTAESWSLRHGGIASRRTCAATSSANFSIVSDPIANTDVLTGRFGFWSNAASVRFESIIVYAGG